LGAVVAAEVEAAEEEVELVVVEVEEEVAAAGRLPQVAANKPARRGAPMTEYSPHTAERTW
jgi:hypothetical protein